MIKLHIEKYRNLTTEELEAREEWKRKNNQFGYTRQMDTLTSYGDEQYGISSLDVEITDEQFEAIRKSVLENF